MEDAPYCGNCEEEIALLYCEECDTHFCRECGEVLHKSAKMKQHHMDRIKPKQLSSEDLLTDEPDTGAVQDGNDNDDSLLNQHSQDNLDLEKTLTPPDPASFLDWSLQDVGAWLATASPAYADYVKAFQRNHIRGRTLPLLDTDALVELGVDGSHIQDLLNRIIKLQLESEKSKVNTMLAQYPRVAV